MLTESSRLLQQTPLSSRWSLALTILLGQVTMALSMFAVILYRTSFGCVYTPLASVILKTLPPERLSMGSGLDGIHRGIGSAFGIAVGSMIVERHTVTHLIKLGEQHELQNLSVQEAASVVAEVLAESGMGHGRAEAFAVLGDHLRQTAQSTAYQDTFLVLCGLTLLALLPALLTRGRRTPTDSLSPEGNDRGEEREHRA